MNNRLTNRYLQIDHIPLPDYEDQLITIHKADLSLTIPLQDGSHHFNSAPIPIGLLNNNKQEAVNIYFSIWYDLDSSNNTLKLCAGNLLSSHSATLHLVTEHSKELLKIQEESQSDPDTIRLSGLAGFFPLLHALIKTVNKALARVAISQAFTVLFRSPLPCFSTDEYLNYSVIYENNRLLGFYDPNKIYHPDVVIKPLEDVWGGTAWIPKGNCFSNIDITAEDRTVRGFRCLNLWESQFGTPTACISSRYHGFPCSNRILGGLMICNQSVRTITTFKNNVFILPICSNHNRNDHYTISALHHSNAIWLNLTLT